MRSESGRIFERIITRKLGNSWSLPQRKIDALSNNLESGESEQDDLLCNIGEIAEQLDIDETSLQHSLIDKLIHAEALLPHHDQLHKVNVKGKHANENGGIDGQYHDDPLLNSILYDVEFSEVIVK